MGKYFVLACVAAGMLLAAIMIELTAGMPPETRITILEAIACIAFSTLGFAAGWTCAGGMGNEET